jgi:hypothetical protein
MIMLFTKADVILLQVNEVSLGCWLGHVVGWKQEHVRGQRKAQLS